MYANVTISEGTLREGRLFTLGHTKRDSIKPSFPQLERMRYQYPKKTICKCCERRSSHEGVFNTELPCG